jgi:hypothetical protein
MTREKFDLDNLRIAAPCPVGWANMAGDDRKRFCASCRLNVYNFSEMTATEVETLVRRSDGKVCARMFRRADGTVLTRDCPVGLAAYRKRVSRFAGAAVAMVIGLFSAGYGQSQAETNKKIVTAAELNINKTPAWKDEIRLYGIVLDMFGAVIPDAAVKLVAADKKNTWSTRTNVEGMFSMPGLRPGLYTLEIKAVYGFQEILVKDIELEAGTRNELNISLEPGVGYESVGGLSSDTNIGPGNNIDPSDIPPPKEVVVMPLKIAAVDRKKPF